MTSDYDGSPDDGIDAIGEDEFVEDLQPGTTPALTSQRRLQKREDTRSALAWAMMCSLGVIMLAGLVKWLFLDASRDDMEAITVLFSPLVTLMGTVLGFYFASTRD